MKSTGGRRLAINPMGHNLELSLEPTPNDGIEILLSITTAQKSVSWAVQSSLRA